MIALTFDKCPDEIVPGSPPEPHANVAFEFGDGIAAVFVDGRQGYIDSAGKLTLCDNERKGSPISHFNEGVIPFIGDKGLWGYLDTGGKIAIPAKFLYTGGFREGLASAMTDKGAGYIDKSGLFVIKPTFDEAGDFSEGLAIVCLKERWGYIDKTGKIVIQPRFAQARGFFEGLAYVELPQEYENLHQGNWGYIDKSGKFVIGPKPFGGGFEITQWYPECLDFAEGLAASRKNGKFGYIDRTGAWVIEPKFLRPGRFSNGIAAVQVPH